VLDQARASREVLELSREYGLEVPPDATIEELPVGIQQRVEIVKALYRKADILILDEPTAVLTPQESQELFRIMRDLAARGVSIIFITHKLKEVFAVATRIVVMRDGRVVGREVLLRVEKGPASPGEVVLTVTGLSALDDRGHQALNGVSFQVRAGEVLGVAGVQGNGQTELVEVLTGLRRPIVGHIRIDGYDLDGANPRRVTKAGTGHIPEDRRRYGMVMAFTVSENLVLNDYFQHPFSDGVIFRHDKVDSYAERLVKEFDIRTPSVETRASALSGGNQQKMVVAREFGRDIKLLIASQPTRGLDVGSIEFIHKRIIEERDQGVAVLLVSAELDEIMSLSDRIAVMYKGEIVATLDAAVATRDQLGLLMAGARLEESVEPA
jgi:ABC-type uncharacterized transport system ATPase subunit